MRYHPIPKDGTIIILPPKGSKESAKTVLYTYEEFLNDNVWGRSQWRKDEAWAKAFERLTEAYDGKKFPDEAASTNDDFEKFQEVASLKGLDIPGGGPNVKMLTRMAQSVLFFSGEPSKTEDPKAAPEATA